jgi:hypothetical protein
MGFHNFLSENLATLALVLRFRFGNHSRGPGVCRDPRELVRMISRPGLPRSRLKGAGRLKSRPAPKSLFKFSRENLADFRLVAAIFVKMPSLGLTKLKINGKCVRVDFLWKSSLTWDFLMIFLTSA